MAGKNIGIIAGTTNAQAWQRQDAENYARSVVLAEFEQGGDSAVVAKVRKDLEAKGVVQSEHQISRTMTELMAKAVADIKAGR